MAHEVASPDEEVRVDEEDWREVVGRIDVVLVAVSNELDGGGEDAQHIDALVLVEGAVLNLLHKFLIITQLLTLNSDIPKTTAPSVWALFL